MQKFNGSRILFVDDEPEILRALARIARKTDAEIITAQSGKIALEIINQAPVDIIVSDMRMPEMNGSELLKQVAKITPETVRIILSGFADMEMVLSAINDGHIWGYLQKPWDNFQLIIKLKQALQLQQVLAERTLMRRTIEQYQHYRKDNFEGFIGDSVAMQFVYSSIEQCAPSNASVFITGPSGSGKEVAAQAIHRLSKRAQKPFIALNCAAIPSELMESEIFGHIKGAFSGAVANRDGAASLADGGTLFLDEIGEMDINLQAKLLRFIQDGKFQKVGSSKEECANIRFISATNRDPQLAIVDKKLREDLFYRLNVISLFLPPLHERENDSLKLAEHFLSYYSDIEEKNFAGFSSDAQSLILSSPWPGNVRQLQNVIHSAVVMSDGPLISSNILSSQLERRGSDRRSSERRDNVDQPKVANTSDVQAHSSASSALNSSFPSSVNSQSPAQSTPSDATLLVGESKSLAAVERRAIKQMIDQCEGNIVKAASELEVSPSTLYRKIQQWEELQAE